MRWFRLRAVPVISVLLALIVVWYVAAVWMNSQWTLDQAARAETTPGFTEIVKDTMVQERPKLPAPHQVAVSFYDLVFDKKVTSKRSLVYHAWVTLSATLFGFAIGTGLGIALALGIVHNRAMDMSVMPWAIASQTIPILAIAPMIIVVLNSIGITGLVPKAVISAYLSFFPVVVGMVAGLRSPDAMQLDLMKTYNASATQVLFKLRLPASMPFLFASLKVGIAAALVGAVVGELPVQQGGLGARLLGGSYYGQTIQMWAALFMAAILAAVLVFIVARVEAGVLKRMGMAR
ncbi:ABC transporter permease [Oceaniglobus trochenteri]|uniref:ABC transporter permease n=1 Tax=Oceaniglobus trochenteri TaxID=2763260 RepID=UPI001CFF9790|nr:ABC transporter permease [Oceaniglobus trochenteri]